MQDKKKPGSTKLSRGAKKISAGPAENKMKKGENLFHDLFIDGLKDVYWAEKYLTKNLPKVIKAATSDELKAAIEEHLQETEGQVQKLERVFELLGEKVQAKKCDAMEGLVDEVSSCIEDTEKGTYTRDAGLIVCAQKVEHYEIAAYGSLTEFAKVMNHLEAAEILGDILNEEKAADEKLNALATTSINQMAMQEWEEEETEAE